MSITKNVLVNWYSSMKRKLRKIRISFYVENSLWKSNFGTFWHLPINPILKIQLLLILRQKFFPPLENSTTRIAITPRLWSSTGKPHIYPGLQFYIVIFVIVNFMPKVLWTIIPTKFIKFKQVSVVNCASFIVPDEVNWKLIYRLYLAFLNKKIQAVVCKKVKKIGLYMVKWL